MNILFAVSEIEGLVKTGGLADVAKYLPLALNNLGHDTRVIVPFYSQIAQQNIQIKHSYSLNVQAARLMDVTVHQCEFDSLTIYCVDIPEFFNREGIYNDSYKAYDDNGERFTVFSLAILAFAEQCRNDIDFVPDIIHCNDWHTAILPALFKSDPYWQQSNCKTVLTIHNGAFQGITPTSFVPSLLAKLGNYHHDYEDDLINFLKLGIIYADGVNAVSPNYANELLTELGSHHLYEIFNYHRDKLRGILNGCDYHDWNPKTNPNLAQNYDQSTIQLKLDNKIALQRAKGMPEDPNIPVISQVCRLTDQKGLNYLLPAIKELMQHKVQLYVAGTGDPIYVAQLEYLANKHSDKFSFYHGFSEPLAHTYMAGSDFFLVPSLFEPCGLTQMYALAYGTIPIVRKVGGLKDTVIDLSCPEATGFIFEHPSSSELIAGIRRALLCYHESPEQFAAMQQRALSTKFLWQKSAEKYLTFYSDLLC